MHVPIREGDKDALWATAVLLGASAFYRMDARAAHEAWPLNAADTDLAWLAMSDGEKAVSTARGQPAVMVANLMGERCERNTLLRFMAFLGCVTAEFKQLLREKDARALAVLAIWYAKLCEYEQWWVQQWWVQQRARLEGQATCIYLETHHGHDAALTWLIEYPKMVLCGG
ncbi:hypothetical protein DV737_g2716, partial [Chaetothyriales sp. CBS 132003]